jgi:hypothetical protein
MVGYIDKAFEAMHYGYGMATRNVISMILCIALYGVFLIREK